MKKPRRNHSPAFKARMVLEVLRGEKTLAQLSALHEVHVTQLTSWKNELLDGHRGSLAAERPRVLPIKYGFASCTRRSANYRWREIF